MDLGTLYLLVGVQAQYTLPCQPCVDGCYPLLASLHNHALPERLCWFPMDSVTHFLFMQVNLYSGFVSLQVP